MNLVRMECTNLMTYERWIKVYQEAMDLLSVIGHTCPFIKDDSVDCYSCKIHNECNYVIGICILQPK